MNRLRGLIMINYRVIIVTLALTLIIVAKPNIAVLELTGSGVDSANLTALTEKLNYELHATDSFNVLGRSEMSAILQEQEFQESGCTDAACATEVGQLLNVDEMVMGSVNKLGELFSITIKSTNVKTAEVIRSVSVDFKGYKIEDMMQNAMKRVALKFAGLDSTAIDSLAPFDIVREGNKNVEEGFKTAKYKGSDKRGKGFGTMSFRVTPYRAAFYLDDSLYSLGERGVTITDVPVGNHRYRAISPDKARRAWDIVGVYEPKDTLEKVVTLRKKKVWFCLEPGFVAIIGPSLRAREISFDYNGSTYATNVISESIATFAPSITFAVESKRFRFELGGIGDFSNFTPDTLDIDFVSKNSANQDTTFSVAHSAYWAMYTWLYWGWKIPIYKHPTGSFIVGVEPAIKPGFTWWESSNSVLITDSTVNIISPDYYGGTVASVTAYTGIRRVQARLSYTLGGGYILYDNTGKDKDFKLNHGLAMTISARF